MKVLLLSSEKKEKESRKRRLLLVRALEDLKIKILNPAYGRPPERKVIKPSLFPKIFYQEQVSLLKKADFVIADLTESDYKTSFLVSYALDLQKPVLVLFWEKIIKEEVEKWAGETFLFSECFNKQNVRAMLHSFVRFLKTQKSYRGKLIVIDGTDGSGKETQSKLLVEYLRKKGKKVKYIDFPRYYSSFHGEMVGRYLKGEFGGLREVNPYLASLFYALDRFTAKEQIEHWLKQGNIIVANRYTSSNMAFQTVRVAKSERSSFLNWLIEMEYKVHKIPKEDLVVFLHVPAEIGQKLVGKKRETGYRGAKKRDIHEANLKLLKKAEKMYLYLTKKFKYWERINCISKEGKLHSIEKIHMEIVKVLGKKEII